jgi:hypothetical protein
MAIYFMEIHFIEVHLLWRGPGMGVGLALSVERLNEHSLEDCLGRQRATYIHRRGLGLSWFQHLAPFNRLSTTQFFTLAVSIS